MTSARTRAQFERFEQLKADTNLRPMTYPWGTALYQSLSADGERYALIFRQIEPGEPREAPTDADSPIDVHTFSRHLPAGQQTYPSLTTYFEP